MEIVIAKGIGESNTTISAFDAALHSAGVCNYNLIALSSIIPPGSQIIKKKFPNKNQFGHKLFCVISKRIVTKPGDEAWAGLGWAQDFSDLSGIFVEFSGSSKSQVKSQITTALNDMVSYRSTQKFDNFHDEIIGIKCLQKPVCAIVIAIFKSEHW